MARQKGIIKIHGKIDDLSFYESQDGFIVRKKGGVDGNRIANDPKFTRTRENGREFGEAASAGKMLRDTIRPLLLNTADNRAVSRLTQVMSVIKNADPSSVRGERNVATALGQPGVKELLKGFDFNSQATLSSKLFKAFDVTTSDGSITIKGLIPIQDVIYPVGATHLEIKGAWARVDFSSGKSELFESSPQNMPIDATANNLSLKPSGQPGGTGVDLFLLKIVFYQEVNGKRYDLKNGSYNVLNIVEVG